MPFDFRELKRLKEVHISLPLDANGYLGRECPAQSCEGYFLMKDSTGPSDDAAGCTCPYCGHAGPHQDFYTKDQVAYAKSVALQQITGAIRRDLKRLEFDYRPPRGSFGIGISMKLQPGPPIPLRYYREKALETFVECTACAQAYGVYGVFAFCPGCGAHNSLEILERNLDLTRRQVALAEAQEDDAFGRHLLDDALENCVSALDGFGREVVRVRIARGGDGAVGGVSFQNLEKAADQLQRLFGVDLRAAVSAATWQAAHRGFMKRHVIAHRAGVVDETYFAQTGDPDVVVGRRIPLAPAEVIMLSAMILEIGQQVVALLLAPGENRP